MKTVVLVGCGKAKVKHAAPAKDLYTGALFRKARAWAERVGDEWGILSAKHFLVMPNQVIEPYDRKVHGLSRDYLRQWIWNTNWFIRSRWSLREKGIRFICLAGKDYAQAFHSPLLLPSMKIEAEFPLEGMGLGRRLQFLGRGSDGARSDSHPAESAPGGIPVAPTGQEIPKRRSLPLDSGVHQVYT